MITTLLAGARSVGAPVFVNADVYLEFVLDERGSVKGSFQSTLVFEFEFNGCERQVIYDCEVSSDRHGYEWKAVEDSARLGSTGREPFERCGPPPSSPEAAFIGLSTWLEGSVVLPAPRDIPALRRQQASVDLERYGPYLGPRSLPISWSTASGWDGDNILYGTRYRGRAVTGPVSGAGRRAFVANGGRLPEGQWVVWMTGPLQIGAEGGP